MFNAMQKYRRQKEYDKKYYQEHKEAKLRRIRKYYQEHREAILECKKQYRLNHKEEIKQYYLDHRERDKQYYQDHKEEKAKQSRQWRLDHKEEIKESKKQYRQDHKEERKEYSKQYYLDHEEKIKERSKQHRLGHPNYMKQWHKNEPEYYKKYYKEHKQERSKHEKNKRKTDLKFNLNERICRAISLSLKGNKAGRHWETLVGFTLNDLIKRLKRTMPEGYTWQDYLEGKLHVDHIIPISVFNYTKPEHIDFKRCWALNNLRLLTAKENLIKNNKLDRPFQPALKI